MRSARYSQYSMKKIVEATGCEKERIEVLHKMIDIAYHWIQSWIPAPGWVRKAAMMMFKPGEVALSDPVGALASALGAHDVEYATWLVSAPVHIDGYAKPSKEPPRGSPAGQIYDYYFRGWSTRHHHLAPRILSVRSDAFFP